MYVFVLWVVIVFGDVCGGRIVCVMYIVCDVLNMISEVLGSIRVGYWL